MNIKEERKKAQAIIEEYEAIQRKIADDDEFETYESYVEQNGGPHVLTVMSARERLEFLNVAEKITDEEIERIQAIPIYEDDMRGVKDIKDKYGLTWNQMKALRGGVDKRERMTVREMRAALGYSRKKFSDAYEIPVRTLEDWEAGKRTPAPYILKLLERAVVEDLKELDSKEE